MTLKNIDFSHVSDIQSNEFDTTNKTPSRIDIDKSLWLISNISEKAIIEKKKYYQEDKEFKQSASRCMVLFEWLEWRDLIVCNNYFEKALLPTIDMT